MSDESNVPVHPPNCVVVSDFSDHVGLDMNANVFACYTSGNKTSECPALLAITFMWNEGDPFIAMLIKDSDWCLVVQLNRRLRC